ncbi:circadian clock protein KaiC [Myxococcota bacterium]|nr:circadian clock protein KaiC [Myxococcota bacterium]
MEPIKKIKSGIPGFDLIAKGGMPKGRTTLVAGTAGSAKTSFAAQFLAGGVAEGEAGVFVTFEEPPAEIRANMQGFGWPIAAWEAEGKWVFVDATPRPEIEQLEVGAYDLGGLLARIEHAVRRVGAQRVVMDSIGALFTQLSDASIVRRELLRAATAFRDLGVTAIITVERETEYGDISRLGVEEFVTEGVIILRNALENEKRRRTIEILKFRGADHQKGEFPFSVLPGSGIHIIPLSAMELSQRSSVTRISSANAELDEMCGGGFFRDSIILVSGATGTGKTLMVSAFLGNGMGPDERGVIFAFEESREQLIRNAVGWGYDFERLEREGRLLVICEYPEVMSLEDHMIRMKEVIDRFKPNRVAIDSLSALERISSERGFREFIISLTCFIKQREIAGLFTATTADLMGGASVTEFHISTITDSIILLRYVEMNGEMRRGITVLKMRGSTHDKNIREFFIDGTGMHIGRSFNNVSGILTGQLVVYQPPSELVRMQSMFTER